MDINAVQKKNEVGDQLSCSAMLYGVNLDLCQGSCNQVHNSELVCAFVKYLLKDQGGLSDCPRADSPLECWFDSLDFPLPFQLPSAEPQNAVEDGPNALALAPMWET